MNIFGFEITRKKTLSPVDNRGGWQPWIREAYSGAWQNNDVWTIDSVLAYPPVYACVTLIASDIAKLEPELKIEGANGICTELPKPSVLKKPNRYQNMIQFIEWWIISKLIRGNTYVLKERDTRGNIIRLYVLEPMRVNPLIAETGEVFYQLGQDVLSGVGDVSATVPASEIIHDRISPLFHPLVGVSPLYACGESGLQGLKIIKDSAKFFGNGARPSGVLTAPGAISEATAIRLKEHWDTNYGGEKVGNVAVLGDGLTFVPMRMSSVDAQLIDQLKWSAEAVCAAFHVPAYKIGAGPMPTNNNVEALTKDYYSQCLQKLIEDFELCMDEGLELPDNQEVELDLDNLFRMDTATQIKTLSDSVAGAIMAPNEARLKINLPPLEGGDSVYLQQQNYSLEALARRDAQIDPFAPSSTVNPAIPDPEEAVDLTEPPQTIDTDTAAKLFALFFEKDIVLEY